MSQRVPESRKHAAGAWFAILRDRLCAAFEAIEDEAVLRGLAKAPPGRFERTEWHRRPRADESGGGGGTMALMRGNVFEKVGVNVSTVWGELDPRFAATIPGAQSDRRFWASGISLVAHMANPFVPAAHLNTRMLETTRAWFGGGADLTPTFAMEPDGADFHAALERACAVRGDGVYAGYRESCDRYFRLPHRDEPRGIGGIFFDDLASDDWEHDFLFVRAVGEAFLETFPRIVVRRMATPYDEEHRQAQRRKRGRYVEFNLLHDRGTRFGLETGGNVDAVLMSLPPDAAW